MNIFKPFLLFVFAGLIITSLAWANSIQEMRLGYNYEQQKLIVNIEFLVRDQQKDFIRKLIIYQNGKEFTTTSYSLQPEYGKFLAEVGLSAKENDLLTVKAFFSEGGTKEATLIVPPPPKEEPTETPNTSSDPSTDALPETSTQVGY